MLDLGAVYRAKFVNYNFSSDLNETKKNIWGVVCIGS